MKRFSIFLLALVAAVSAVGQIRDQILADIDKTAGVYRLYPSEFARQTPTPKGYKPFYISHYGRHGSRYVLRNHKFDSVLEILKDAEASDDLTPLGKDVLGRLQRAAQFCAGRAGDLSPLGQQQQHGIAARMCQSFPEIFGGNPKITSVATVVPRVIMSMAAFNNELMRHNPTLDIEMDTGNKYMPYLNPYSYENDPVLAKRIDTYRYPEGDWVESVHEFFHNDFDGSRILYSLFKKEYADRLIAVKPIFATTFFLSFTHGDTFITNLFKVAVNLPNTPCEERLDDLFTPDERYRLWRAMNMIFYYEKGPSGVGDGLLNEVSATLVKEFEDDAAEKIAAGKPAVTLRFGHDGCIMGLLNTLRVKGWSDYQPDKSKIEELWHDFDIPMACNVQWIFYRNAKNGDVLVKMLLNEEELEFPVQSDMKPYYHWKDVKALCDKVLAEQKIYNFGK